MLEIKNNEIDLTELEKTEIAIEGAKENKDCQAVIDINFLHEIVLLAKKGLVGQTRIWSDEE